MENQARQHSHRYNEDEIIKFYDEMLDICVAKEHSNNIEKINEALRNWNAVGAYLVFEESNIDTQLTIAENELEDYTESIQLMMVRGLKAEFGNSFNPTQAAIAAKARENVGIAARFNSLREAKQSLKTKKAKIEKLIRMHDGFKQILSTISSNIRTDFIGSGTSRNSNPHFSHSGISEVEAKAQLGG